MQDQSQKRTPLNFSENFPKNDLLLAENLHNSRALVLLSDRAQLRAFLAESFKQPDFLSSPDFSKISAWAVKKNQFPMLLKSCKNQANCENILLLKAFRELPEFFDRLEKHKPVLIESLFPAKARIEATFFLGQLVLISQIGIERSMHFYHSWRVFPIFPPSGCLKEILKTAELFSELIKTSTVPIRISFAFNPDQTVPLSINSGFNRHEYFPEWGDCLFNPQTEKPPKNIALNKLLFFRAHGYQIIDSVELQRTLQTSLKKITVGEPTVILLQSDKPAVILEDSKKADAFFKHLGPVFEPAQDPD
ncbi:MAG: hypothetical protein ACOYXC_03300 [Candidatus Rifleibacteriota bacterium]